jgi:hypothetical protein
LILPAALVARDLGGLQIQECALRHGQANVADRDSQVVALLVDRKEIDANVLSVGKRDYRP